MAEHETLLKNVRPINYRLTLEPDMSTFKTHGEETVAMEVNEPTDALTLNASKLAIEEASLVVGKKRLVAEKIEFNKEDERVTFLFSEQFSGQVKLNVKFTADNNDKLYGFYRSTYKEGDQTKHILTTQFESADARSAFPCIDEPEAKATLDVTLRIDEGLDAISNMPEKNVRRLDGILSGKKEVTFERTPKMSTYLLYMGVGRFNRRIENDETPALGLITTPAAQFDSKLPLEYARKFLKFYEHYFEIKFPLPKIDLIAIPDFSAGAMENWGAITFRETSLLSDESASQAARMYTADVIAHELAHQWFGNLVTMKWWNDLWLNESFATMMRSKAVDSVFPKWQESLKYVPDNFGEAFAIDSLASTHPIEVEINNVAESEGIFDAISYQKGGSVLHMLEDYVGAENFRQGLIDYLKANAHSNATKSDLWDALSKHSNGAAKDIKRVAQAWIEKPGHPIIYVERRPDGKLLLRQKRFMFSGAVRDVWPIPIHYKTNKSEGFILLDEEERLINEGGDWIKLNYGQHGFYRVNYDDVLLDGVGKAVLDDKLSSLDAWGVENDLFAFTRAGSVSVKKYLGFMERFLMSQEYPLVENTLGHVSKLEINSYGMEISPTLLDIKSRLARPLVEKLGWNKKDGETTLDTRLRGVAISALGAVGDADTVNKARELFQVSCSGQQIDNDLLLVVYDAVACNGDSATYKQLVERYRNSDTADETRASLYALGSFKDKKLLLEALDFAHSSEVRPQDSYGMTSSIAVNPAGAGLLWEWTKKNWSMLKERYSGSTHLLGRYIDNLSAVYDRKQKEDIIAFFSDKNNMRLDLERPLKETLEFIDLNIKYREFNASA